MVLNNNKKVSIIGAGAVGSATAFALAIKGTAREIVLVDINKERAVAEAADIEHGSLFYPTNKVIGTDDYAAIADSQLVVITSGARQKPGQTRIELAGDTIEIMKSIIPNVLKYAPDAIFLIVANPVDIVTYVCQQISGISCRKLFGSGTVLDSSRLRANLASETGINVRNIHAYIAGEHGDSEIVLWDSAIIGGVPVKKWVPKKGYPPLTDDKLELIHQNVINAAYEVIKGKGATNYAVALAVDNIARAVLGDENRIMPVSTRIRGIEGLEDVCLSLPFSISANGVSEQVGTVLSNEELTGLRKSANSLKNAMKELGY